MSPHRLCDRYVRFGRYAHMVRIDLRRGGVWLDVCVVAAIVAAGITVAGLTDSPQPEVAAIPGCDVVVPDLGSVSFAIGSYGGTYDNPAYPWLTAAKASAMSLALIDSLPGDVELDYAPPSRSLIFQPINVYPGSAQLPEGITLTDISGDSTASGVVGRGGVEASLRVSVKTWDRGFPPCTEGQVDQRTTLSDGTVIDSRSTVAGSGDNPSHRQSVIAYSADTLITASTSKEGEDSTLPLEVEELRDIVSNPELRIGAEVPKGTPPPRRDCGGSRENPVSPLTRDEVERIGIALERQWAVTFPDIDTDWPVGDLVPGSSGGGSACNQMNVTLPSGAAELTVEISTQEIAPRRDESGSPEVDRRVSPDGTVITYRSDEYAGSGEATGWLSVFRPSNTLVQFRFGPGFDVESLVELATGPGLDL